MLLNNDLSVYIHWPFCKFKCPYCDFNSHVREKISHDDWRKGYERELEYYREITGARRVHTVFFGGGTPSLMAPETAGAVIDKIAALWDLDADAEITLEANPTSVEAEKLHGFRSAGVNRVSLGVQALQDADLKKLGRQHSAAEALSAVKLASGIFDRYTFDLIYARPDQTPSMWEAELKNALQYARGHLSLYQLTIEEGTQYHTLFQRGELKIPDEETGARMYELTQDIMGREGMPAYEVSNHARPGHESRHNLVYWRYQDYAGIGPGAHGRLTLDGKKYATRAHRAPEIWLDKVAQDRHGAHPFEEITQEQRAREMLMMGLRLAEGIDVAALNRETGMAVDVFVPRQRLQAMIDEGYLGLDDKTIKATLPGRQRLNAVLTYLLG